MVEGGGRGAKALDLGLLQGGLSSLFGPKTSRNVCKQKDSFCEEDEGQIAMDQSEE